MSEPSPAFLPTDSAPSPILQAARPIGSPRALAAAPARLVESGAPLPGSWSGTIADARLDSLAAPYARGVLARRLVEKKWQYACVLTPEVMLTLAIVETGYLSSGFCAVFDRGARKLMLDEHPLLPPLCASVSEAPGLQASLIGPGVSVRIERNGDLVRIAGRWRRATLDLTLDSGRALPPLSACALLSPGRFDFTQKTVGAAADGELRIGSTRYSLQGGAGALDYTHGFLERDTNWRWALGNGHAGGRRIGFNFSEGFLGPSGPENAVWIDGAPAATGPVSFSYDPKQPGEAWTLRSDDGGVDLTFNPEGLRAQDVDFKVLTSRYVNPFGTFSGHLTSAAGERVSLSNLAGVTEDHVARW